MTEDGTINRIVGISGSPRHGFTELFVAEVLKQAHEISGLDTQLLSLAGKRILSCDDCKACNKRDLPRLCKIQDDWYDIVSELLRPGLVGLVIGSPVYTFNINSKLAAFMERFTVFHQRNYFPDAHSETAPDWSRTAAGVVAVGGGRNGGQEATMTSLINWLLTNGFAIVGCYPRSSIGVSCYEPTGSTAVSDERGIKLAKILAANIVKTGLALQGAPEEKPMAYHEPADLSLLGTRIGS